jgi:hypothetical protein
MLVPVEMGAATRRANGGTRKRAAIFVGANVRTLSHTHVQVRVSILAMRCLLTAQLPHTRRARADALNPATVLSQCGWNRDNRNDKSLTTTGTEFRQFCCEFPQLSRSGGDNRATFHSKRERTADFPVWTGILVAH